MSYGMKGGDANRHSPKRIGKNKQAHTADTPYGMGDYYGQGIKAKMGEVRDETIGMKLINPVKMKKPPKTTA